MKIKLLLIIILFFPSFILAQSYEATEVDILSQGKLPDSNQITVLGISIENTVQEVLTKFKKRLNDFKQHTENASFVLAPEPGIVITTIDKKSIESILLRYEGKEKFKGETADFFNLRTYKDYSSYLENKFGSPDFILYDESSLMERAEFYYSASCPIRICRKSRSVAISIELIAKDRIVDTAKEKGAKTPKEVLEEERITKLPLSKSGFRKALWGMSKEEVQEVESSKLVKKDTLDGALKGLEVYIYQGNVGGMDCGIAYYFANDQLTRARYMFIQSHTNKNLYISDFESIKQQLSKKYGPPVRDQKIWLNNLYKDDLNNYGMAVSVGHLKYVTEWETSETYVQLLLQGDNYKINLWTEYTGKDFCELEKKVIKKAKEDIW